MDKTLVEPTPEDIHEAEAFIRAWALAGANEDTWPQWVAALFSRIATLEAALAAQSGEGEAVVAIRPNADLNKLAAAMEAVLHLRPQRPVDVSPDDARVIIAVLKSAAR